MTTPLPTKEKTGREGFAQWLDNYVDELEFIPALNDSHRRSLFGRLETLREVKAAFNHFVKEIDG